MADWILVSAGTLATGNAGVRGGFEDLTTAGDGVHQVWVQTETAGADVNLGAGLRTVRAGASLTATLELRETAMPAGVLASVSVPLSSAETTAIANGAAFTIDLFVDRVGVALASVQVAGFAPVEASIPVAQLGTDPLVGFATLVFEEASAPAPTAVDMTAIELFADLPRSFNIDVGNAFGTPSASYGGAGPAGEWNTIGLGTTALVDIDGIASGVEANLSTQSDTGGFVGGTPDEQALSGDHAFECIGNPDVWTLEFTGLSPGSYRVLIYAPANNFLHTGAMTVNGTATPNLTGDTGFALIQGVSWDEVITPSNGSITLTGTEGTTLCAGIAGVQLIPTRLTSVPAVPSLALWVLAAGLTWSGVRRLPR